MRQFHSPGLLVDGQPGPMGALGSLRIDFLLPKAAQLSPHDILIKAAGKQPPQAAHAVDPQPF